MPSYRVVCLQGATYTHGVFEADDDEEALILFALRREKGDCVIHCGERTVASVPRGGPAILATPAA